MTDEQLDRELGRKVARASFATRTLVVVGGTVLTAILLTTTFTVNQIRHQQVQSRGTLISAQQAARAAARTSAEVHSCVTPGEPCNQRNTRQTVAYLLKQTHGTQQAAAAAASCAARLPDPTYTNVLACELRALSKGKQP